jgi:hypothetical protein
VSLLRTVGTCAALLLFVTACAHRSYTGAVSKMPPCYINGQKGVWLSVDSGPYRCLSQLEWMRWRARMGL